MNIKIKQTIILVGAIVMNLFFSGVGNLFIGQKKIGIFYMCFNIIAVVTGMNILLNPSGSTILGLIFMLFYLVSILLSIIHLIPCYRKNDFNLKPMIKKGLICGAFLILSSMFEENLINKIEEHYQSSIAPLKGSSMEKTFYNGDFVLYQKRNGYERGDVLGISKEGLIRVRKTTKYLCKRLIAFEGEVVRIKNGKVFVNGKEIKEERIKDISYKNLGDSEYGVWYSYQVPKGCVYVLGDNSGYSNDSRYFGAVPLSNIKGKVLKTIWPLNRISNN